MNKSFMLLWFGKIISQLGDKFYTIALAWWILQKTNDPAAMGLFMLVSILPGILTGLFSGALTDRWNRKTVLIVTDALRGLLVSAASLLAFTSALEVWHVFAIGFLLSAVTAFFDPAIQAIIPEIVPEESLKKANGMSQTVSGFCTVLGPMLGAVAAGTLGLGWAFMLNGVSYLLSALMTCFIHNSQKIKEASAKPGILREIREGILFIKGSKRITFILKIIALAHVFMGCLTVSLPFLALRVGSRGVGALGALEMMMGLGLVSGSLSVIFRRKAAQTAKSLLLMLMTAGLSFLSIGILQFFSVQALWVYMGVMAVIGAVIAGASVYWQTLLQTSTPAAMTGRVFGISTLTANVSLPIANALFGILLGFSPISLLLSLCGILLTAFCFWQLAGASGKPQSSARSGDAFVKTGKEADFH
jgi:MFS family permease